MCLRLDTPAKYPTRAFSLGRQPRPEKLEVPNLHVMRKRACKRPKVGTNRYAEVQFEELRGLLQLIGNVFFCAWIPQTSDCTLCICSLHLQEDEALDFHGLECW